MTTRILFVILLVVVLGAACQAITPLLAGFTWAGVLVAASCPRHPCLERAFGGRQRAPLTVATPLVAPFVVVPVVVAADVQVVRPSRESETAVFAGLRAVIRL